MHKNFKALTLLTATLLLLLQTLQAQDIPECSQGGGKRETTYFGSAQLNLVSSFYDDALAIALLGEVGPANYRANGTIGSLYDCHMIKVGGEFLGQKIKYNFSSGNEKRWVHQYAVGGRYEYVQSCDWFQSIFISGQAAHAPSEHLADSECTIGGVTNFFERRLAGSTYYNVEGGVTFAPWEYASFLVGAGYNKIRYDKVECGEKNFQGLGVDVEFAQRFCDDFVLDLKGEFRRPYNYAEAALNWQCDTSCGILSIGIFGGYVWGKTDLPNVTTAGVEFGLNFGPCQTYRHSSICSQSLCCGPSDSERLRAWVSDPAVYMPIVLVVAEERNTGCGDPIALDQIPEQVFCKRETFLLNSSLFFTGAALTFSMTTVDHSGGNIQASIDPTTGVITATDTDTTISIDSIDITVTATNACGAVTLQTFTLTFVQCPCEGPPTRNGTMPDITICKGGLRTIPTATYFNYVEPVIFSLVYNVSPNYTLTIDPSTGVISYTSKLGPQFDEIDVTVTVTDPCGSVSQNQFHITGLPC